MVFGLRKNVEFSVFIFNFCGTHHKKHWFGCVFCTQFSFSILKKLHTICGRFHFLANEYHGIIVKKPIPWVPLIVSYPIKISLSLSLSLSHSKNIYFLVFFFFKTFRRCQDICVSQVRNICHYFLKFANTLTKRTLLVFGKI